MARSTVVVLALLAAVVAVGFLHDDENDEPGAAAPAPPVQRFVSRPDLQPPPVEVLTPARGTAPGYVLLAPKRGVAQAGPLILDNRGEVVWFHPLDTAAVADFRAQRYGGRPVLTWWRGRATRGVGDGYYVIVDDAYRQIATVTAGNGLKGDIHEFLITPRDTALITIYQRKPRDLSPVGGPVEGEIFDGVVQEVDITTGRVLFEWHSADHVELEESYVKPPPAAQGAASAPYDYFHINSVSEDDDGNLLVSARNTRAVYKIGRGDGRVVWRLGGKRSDYAMGPGTRFAWQHDAHRQPDGTLTLFDNAADPKTNELSRVLVLRLDDAARRATLVRSYGHPRKLLSGSQGNAQFLANGHVFVGWGSNPYLTEFDRRGRVLFDLRFGAKGADSYRAYRAVWAGRPTEDPAVSATTADGGATVHVSWNGATGVDRWQVVAGPDAQRTTAVVATVAPGGFETAIPVDTTQPYVRVRALNSAGAVLGTSRAVQLGEPADD